MSLLQRQRPRRRFVFMLTPLVDVMFLLLIFFMLSSQTAPYSLLEIMAEGQPAATPAPAQTAAQTPPWSEMIIAISRDYARVNGQRIEMAELAAALAQYKAAGFERAVVLPTGTATVQDVVSVIEAVKQAALSQVRVVSQGRAQ
jgi:biopolymer transport protein ExbD